MERTFHIFIGSDQSRKYFPRNIWSDFYVQLPEIVQLKGENWHCTVVELRATLNSFCYLCCDLCETSIVDNTRRPVLRSLTRKTTYEELIYVPVIKSEFSVIHLYILNAEGEKIALKLCTSTVYFDSLKTHDNVAIDS